ncbi:hypothetical protein BH23PLA1_BH23PLA1_35780 [soil metagenome]
MKTTAYRCDRCGVDCTSDGDRNRLAMQSGPLTRWTDPEGYDLCGACSSRLTEWLQGRLDEPGRSIDGCSKPIKPVQS